MKPSRAAAAALAAVVLAAAPGPALAQAPESWTLVVLEPAPSAASPVAVEVVPRAVQAATAALGTPPAGPTTSVRRCGADEGPVTPAVLAASFARAQERYYRGEFEAAWTELDEWLGALQTGCRPLSAQADGWRDPGPVEPLHDAGTLLLMIGADLRRSEEAERRVRLILATFPGARPADGMFPPSLADRYLDVEPDETEVGRVAVDAPGCEVNVAGRIVREPARVLAGDVPVGFRCGGESFVLTARVAPGSSVRLAAVLPEDVAGMAPAERLVVRVAAAAASLARVELGVAVEAAGTRARVGAWAPPGVAAAWTLDPADPALGEALASFAGTAAEAASPGGDSEAALWGAVALAAAGAALAGGGAWALIDAQERDAASARAATVAGNERLAAEADALGAAGWTLVGVGAAAAAGGLVWLAIELAGGEAETAPADDGGPELLPVLGPAALGLRIAF
jgi:hypothetical protein